MSQSDPQRVPFRDTSSMTTLTVPVNCQRDARPIFRLFNSVLRSQIVALALRAFHFSQYPAALTLGIELEFGSPLQRLARTRSDHGLNSLL